jgi:hypothetical protein
VLTATRASGNCRDWDAANPPSAEDTNRDAVV